MKIGIIGLANSGKSTIFNALTGQNVPTTTYPTVEAEPNVGVVKVPDARAHRLAEIYKPKKVTFAAVEYIDYLGITKGDVQQNRKVLDMIKDVDAVVHVIRAFKDESVAHPLGGVNPLRDAAGRPLLRLRPGPAPPRAKGVRPVGEAFLRRPLPGGGRPASCGGAC